MDERKRTQYTLIFTDLLLEDLAFHDETGNWVTIKRIERFYGT